MAHAGTLRVDLEQDGVEVAVGGDLFDYEAVAGAFAFHPELLARAAKEGDEAGFYGLAEGLFVHVADHEDTACRGVLHDSGDESVRLGKIEIHTRKKQKARR